jgi:hypothetical protein
MLRLLDTPAQVDGPATSEIPLTATLEVSRILSVRHAHHRVLSVRMQIAGILMAEYTTFFIEI